MELSLCTISKIDGHFVFASEIKSILAFPGYERKVNQKALEQYLSFQYSPLEETFFRGIYKLMPGHMLLYKNGNYEIKTYFKTKLTPDKWNRKTNMDQLRSQLAEIFVDGCSSGQSGADLQRDPHLCKIRQSESAGGWIWDQSGAACETGNEPL